MKEIKEMNLRKTILSFLHIPQELKKIMSAIDNLKDAVSGIETNVNDGFSAIQAAMQELATDIQNLPTNSDVEAEAARLSGIATAIADGTASFAQSIKDAIPTETKPAPSA